MLKTTNYRTTVEKLPDSASEILLQGWLNQDMSQRSQYSNWANNRLLDREQPVTLRGEYYTQKPEQEVSNSQLFQKPNGVKIILFILVGVVHSHSESTLRKLNIPRCGRRFEDCVPIILEPSRPPYPTLRP